MKTTISIMVIVSILFYLIYKRSFSMVEETSDLFMMYAFVSNTVAFMLPLTVYIFCMITAALMSNILDLAYDPKKYAHIVSLSFIPVILNCLIYLGILYNVSIGLTAADMKEINMLAWIGFYIIFFTLTKIEFEINFLKTFLVTVLPSLSVQIGKFYI